MDAVSYPQTRVESFIHENLVPLRIPADDRNIAPKFTIKWTPTLIVLDSSGREHHRTVGFLSPDELVPSLLLGMGKAAFDTADRGAAVRHLDRLLDSYPDSFFAPEAAYLRGVSGYIETHDVSNLFGICDVLKERYPESHWVMRASPYELLRSGYVAPAARSTQSSGPDIGSHRT